MEKKTIDKKLKTFPVKFELKKKFELKEEDIRYDLAKIYIMHDGANYNGSKFSKEVIEENAHTLVNMPILCYIENGDFSDHRYKVDKNKDGETIYKCVEQCIGVIPESADIYMEEKLGDDGIMRNYLVADNCIVWRKWDDVNDIFEDNNIKSHSCELADDYEGDFDNEGYFNFTKFSFFGFTVLGDEVKPAMSLSSIEVRNFAQVNMEVIQKRLSQFQQHFSQELEKEGDEVSKKVEKFETESTEDTSEVGTTEKFEGEDTGEPETKEVCETHGCELVDGKCPECESESDDTEDDEDFAKKKKKKKCSREYQLKFEISHEDIRNKIYDKLYDLCMLENAWYGIYKTCNEYFIYGDENHIYKQSYTIENDELVFNSEREEVYMALVDKDTYESIKTKTYSQLEAEFNNSTIELGKANVELTRVNSEFTKVEEELVSLREFKNNVEIKERKEKIDAHINKNFSFVPEIDMAEAREKAYSGEISMDEFDNAIYITMGRKGLFSLKTEKKEEKNESMRLFSNAKNENNEECEYASIAHLFTKRD